MLRRARAEHRLMTFNPFPWARPVEDRRVSRAEPLTLGSGKIRDEPFEPLAALALVVGLAVPAVTVVMLMGGLPPWCWFLAGALALSGLAAVWIQRMKQRRRAAQRARGRELRRSSSGERARDAEREH
jgi:hypothetical protein